ncbi:methionyl-tRNA formyltransferase [Actinokineospora bangkokensis]|uniref:Methionyl-tRNA formyltransferase n=1 Tax=Actinokineospora bangkokensis TaxID=1193682 RepID=A0A1Q9LCR2_9PSEU|nr:methionyl-tRNA formyltransferase [Actinokineospora bangkokensis]OLR89804.1 methionyl-tRNA formyltransferase [Actinokineospora bangkokensis]
MRVVMFGFQTWGHRTLRALVESDHEVVAVVTHPRGGGVYERVWGDSVEDLAREHGIPVVLRERPDAALVDELRAFGADIFVAANWRTYLPAEVFDLPPLGTLNIHDSLLPAYAGFSAMIWALINDEPEVGVTAHMMDATLDAGDIVLQRSFPVGPRDTSGDLVLRSMDVFGPITVDALALIASGERDWQKQDRSRASFFHKRAEEDLRIDWTWSAEELDRLVRAQSAPYPSAFCFHRGERLEIVTAEVSREVYGGTPGRIFYREGDGVAIVAGAQARRGRSKALLVKSVRTPEGEELSAEKYFTHMGGYLTSRP